MKKIRKMMALFFCFALFVSMSPITSLAANTIGSGKCGEEAYWKITDDAILRISGKGEVTEHPWIEYDDERYPSFIYPVKNIIVEEGITSICYDAFDYCSSLEEAHLPNSLSEISEWQFTGCTSLTGVWVNNDNPNYSNDSRGVLLNKDKTELHIFPQGISGEYDIPDTVKRLTIYEFSESKVSSIRIPASVEEAHGDAFQDCPLLKKIIVDSNNPYFSNDDNGALFNKDKTELLRLPGGFVGEYIVPDTVISMPRDSEKGGGVFSDCRFLTSVVIPEGIKLIDAYSFMDCISLTNVKLPESLETIEFGAFDGCSSLYSITIPRNVSYIGWHAFSIYEEYDGVLEGNTSLFSILFEGNAPKTDTESYESGAFFNVKATAYYPMNNSSWTEEARHNLGEYLVWEEYDPASPPVFASHKMGDIDGDDSVTNTDLVTIARYIVGLSDDKISVAVKNYADMNGDGNVDNLDIVTVARMIVGLQ